MTVTALPRRKAATRTLLEIVDDLNREVHYAKALSLAIIGEGTTGAGEAVGIEYLARDHQDRLQKLAADLDAIRVGGAS